MKLRFGFVSNSSSASFIINFKSSLPEDDLIHFISTSNVWYENHVSTKERNGSLLATFGDDGLYRSEDMYQLVVGTIMFNDWTEIIPYNFIRAIDETMIEGIELIDIIQTEDECDSTHKKVEFDSKNIYDNSQNAVDIEYINYLGKIGSVSKSEKHAIMARCLLKNIER